MNTPAATTHGSGGIRILAAMGEMLASMMSLAERLDVFLVAHRRAAQDRADLNGMTERELADIGLPRASIGSAAQGDWSRGPMI